MHNLPEAQFPQKRLDALIASAASFDRLNLRADSLSPKAMGFLHDINPGLAIALQTGADTRYIRDAAEGVSFARSLEHVRAGLLDVLFSALEGLQFVNIEPGVDPGKEIFTYQGQKRIGRAEIVKNYADNAPRSEVTGLESFVQIRGLRSSYQYTTQEVRATMNAQQPIDVRKAMAARESIATLLDEIIFYGSTEGGLLGLLTQTGTTSYTIPTGAAGSKLWRRKTADEIVADMHGIVNTVVKATIGVHRPDAMLLPLAAYNIAATRSMGDGRNQTCLQFFRETSPYIKSVSPSYRLDAQFSGNPAGTGWGGTANTGRMMVYEKRTDRMSLIMPIEFEQGIPFQKHTVTETECYGRVGGVVLYYSGSVAYGDGLTDAQD